MTVKKKKNTYGKRKKYTYRDIISLNITNNTSKEVIDWINEQKSISKAIMEVLETYVHNKLIPVNIVNAILEEKYSNKPYSKPLSQSYSKEVNINSHDYLNNDNEEGYITKEAEEVEEIEDTEDIEYTEEIEFELEENYDALNEETKEAKKKDDGTVRPGKKGRPKTDEIPTSVSANFENNNIKSQKLLAE